MGQENVSRDEILAGQLRRVLPPLGHVTEKKMFGGIGFLLNGNVCCGVWKEFLILRLGDDIAPQVLREPHARPFDITGRAMRGWAMVEPAGWTDEQRLRRWVSWAVDFTESLPAK
jgi:TfoX/Sxy family transcriptional regulator of competence genes